MDMKRLVVAVVLSVAMVFGWNLLSIRMGWVPEPRPEATQTTQPPANIPEVSQTETQKATQNALQSPIITVDTPLYRAEFVQNGAILRTFVLKKYTVNANEHKLLSLVSQQARQYGIMGLLINAKPTWGTLTWKVSSNMIALEKGTQTMVFTGENEQYIVERKFTFNADTYAIVEDTTITTKMPHTSNVELGYTLGASPINEVTPYDITGVAWLEKGSLHEEKDKEELQKGQEIRTAVEWVGIMDRYFLLALLPPLNIQNVTRIKQEHDVFRIAVYESVPAHNNTLTKKMTYWLGPKQQDLLTQQPNNLQDAINYGFFSFLSKPLLIFLETIHAYVHNYGIAIILLTVLIKLLFWPLSQKSFASMRKMKEIQPLLDGVREKYKDNKEEMNREIMRLYKTYQVNPLGGCLPLLLQIPVFFALYEVLLNALALRHTPFIEYLPFTHIQWLTDLSVKDPFYITPILMGISMFVQQLFTPATGDPIQRKIMLAMPVVFTVFFLNFPSGLVLYWLSSNIISIFQQWLVNRPTKK